MVTAKVTTNKQRTPKILISKLYFLWYLTRSFFNIQVSVVLRNPIGGANIDFGYSVNTLGIGLLDYATL